jgi:hypothetical protein
MRTFRTASNDVSEPVYQGALKKKSVTVGPAEVALHVGPNPMPWTHKGGETHVHRERERGRGGKRERRMK